MRAPRIATIAATAPALESQIDAVRQHLRAVVQALPTVPQALGHALRGLRAEVQAQGSGSLFGLLLAFAALGLGTERLFWVVSGRVRRWIIGARLDTPGERLRAVLARGLFGTSWVAAFALGSIGAFLAFDWPPVLRQALLGLLVAIVMVRLCTVLGRFLFAPGAERFRIVPMDTPSARFWHRRVVAFGATLAIASAVIQWLIDQNVDYGVWRVVAYGVSLLLLGLAIEALWRRPGERNERRATLNWLLTVAFVVLLMLRVVGAFPLFWLGALVLVFVGLAHLITRVSAHLQRPPDGAPGQAVLPSVAVAVVGRSLRLLLAVGTLLAMAMAWGIHPLQIADAGTLSLRMLRGALHVVVILLVAELLWYVFKTTLEQRLAEAQSTSADDAQASRAMRLRTVLPILRNVTLVALVVMAVLMALSAVGIEIAPLVAGAGVVGVAVGFGSQTLVKDVMSGFFYLLDDAFRVGEYIQSGSFKGTVESFSLRSVRLRHHRGPVYTVPFGDLGAVQNLSRDWVIDKLTVGVTYDSNLERARKLIKAIGQELAADPDMGRHILEPLKMQGVEQFGDFAIQIRMKMMTRPGEQFVIRRKALAMIKTAFDANGVKFAFPTVQIAGGSEAPAAPVAAAAAAATQPVLGQAPA